MKDTPIGVRLLILFAILGLFGPGTASADDEDEDGDVSFRIGDLSNSFDFKKLGGMAGRLAPHGNDLMGDLIDKNTGGITFEHTDVAIPGNSNLEVAIRRKFSQGATSFTPHQQGFGDWVLDLPIAHAVFGSRSIYNRNLPRFSGGCLNDLGDMGATLEVQGGRLQPDQHTDGVTLKVPGKGLSGFRGPFKTPEDPKSNWVSGGRTTDHAGRCATVVVASDGTKYKFGRHVSRKAKSYLYPVTSSHTHGGGGTITTRSENSTPRLYAVFLVTEVQDVSGNWVRYDYTNNSRAELTRIYSNDGRDIRLQYETAVPNAQTRNSRRVSRITAHGRAWTYRYVQPNGGSIAYLRSATLPDGRFWEFRDTVKMSYEVNRHYKCLPYDHTFSMKHPDGAIGTFRVRETRHIKGASHLGNPYDDDSDFGMQPMNTPFARNNSVCYTGTAHEKPFERPVGWPIYRTMSVVSKQISGSGLPTATWNFEYRNYTGGSLDQTWTRVTGADGTRRTYTYQTVGADYGLLKRVDVVPRSGSGETITYEYDLTRNVSDFSIGGYRCKARGRYGDTSGMCRVYDYRPITRKIQRHNGDTYTTQNIYNKSSNRKFADYGYPNRVKRYSSISGSTAPRDTVKTYQHKTGINVIGLTTRIVRNGRELATYSYDSLGRKTRKTRYGQHDASFTYHTRSPYRGALATATDALGRQVYRTHYKRGIAQSIRRPDNRWLSVRVNDDGWMTSSTDAMGQTTSYTRDNMGRLTLINPPGSWANTSIAYSFSGGGAVQTITRGQSRETITYDELYRPILERNQALDTGWSSYVNTNYHAAGQVKFKSQPSSNLNESKGVDYTYDGLGRIYQERENVAPYATTKHRYYSSNRHRIYDPSGAFTQYHAHAYDGPGSTDYLAIHRYANGAWQQYNYLYKNIHGQLTRLRQRGNRNGYNVDKSQYFYYDSKQRLCRHYVPEHGATRYQYDAAGQMTAYAKGQSNSGCGTVPSSSAKVSQSYDRLGQPTLTNFYHSGTPDISRTYDANGNVKTVNRGGVNWSYSYNTINLPTREYLDVDGRSYDLAYYYNSSAHLTRKTLPSTRNIYYTPDGLGRFRTIMNGSATLASNTRYHAGGQLTAMRYGNGQTLTQTLNSRLLPRRLLSYKGSQKAIDQTLGYDVRGKITSITDGAVSGNNRSYGYDGLGRLTTATGPWGSGSYRYDPLDNLRQKRLGSRTVNLTYDSRNRVFRSADTGPSGTRTLAYDARGNVTTLGSLAFAYDYSDQPVAVSGTASGNYKYDGNLKRVRSIVNGKTIYNVYDISGKLVHIDAVTDNKKTDYIDGPTGSLARITNNIVTYLHSDHLGSAQSGTNTSGNVAWREKYTPYGEEMNGQSANDNQAGFTGHIKDKATGLNYMQARYYDPVVGRFLSIDPVTFLQTGDPRYFNRYMYAGNDPINNLDPNGEAIGKAIKFVRNTIKHNGNPIKGGADTLAGIADDLGTLADGQLNLDDASAVFSLITGLDKKDQKAIGGAAKGAKNAADKARQARQRQRRNQRRENQSRDENGQKRTGEGSRYEGKQEGKKGPAGDRPSGPDRSNNRERNQGIDEEHSMKPKGTPRPR